MIKILKIIFILSFLLITSCGFKPILVKSNYDFSINIKNSLGSDRVNRQITGSLENLNGSTNYQVSLISNEQKNTISKDSKGDPSILEIILNLNYKVEKGNEILINKNLVQRSTYNNISDKFELSKSEEILVQNLTENFIQEIISSISSLKNDN
jgi:outer membrane lipopolysaccharide assembly protein LptE/RlpB